jgi:hypothetical protein
MMRIVGIDDWSVGRSTVSRRYVQSCTNGNNQIRVEGHVLDERAMAPRVRAEGA